MVKQGERPMPVEKVGFQVTSLLSSSPKEVLTLRLPKRYQLKAGVRQRDLHHVPFTF